VIHVPGYSVIGQIGRGGMATVYRARQTLLDREVALKVMAPQLTQDPVYAQRFLQEARMLAALNHPHVVPVYDVGVTPEGLHYFSMQLLCGGDFSSRMRDGLSELELVRVLVAVAHALGFAHARGYVHRDVSPANILFDAHDTPVLTDFGIARAVTATSRITAGGLSIGTSHYMSPEQARGAEVDHRSDIYSLGVLCYEALAGQPPYDGEDGFAVAFAHVHDPVPALPEEVARWQPLIDRAMAKDPAKRYPDCAAFIEGLRAVAPEEFGALGPIALSTATRKISTPPPAPLRPRIGLPARPPWSVLGIGAGAGVLVGLLAWLLFGPAGEERAPPAEAEPAQVRIEAPAEPAMPPAPPTLAAIDGEPAPADGDGVAAIEQGIDSVAAEPAEAQNPASEPAEPHTVVDPVARLVALGHEDLAALRLTRPAERNAMDNFRTALRIEPGNRQAGAGIAEVAQRYLDLAGRRDPLSETEAWVGFLLQAEQVATEHPLAAEKGELARGEREQFVAAQLERGREAIGGWDGEAAREAFARALLAEPGNRAAVAGLARAEQVGRPGYRFVDGEGLPELVVVDGGLALGRDEVTVGQFRVYWNAAGRQRFGEEPGCRDRESTSVFHGTRGRGFSAPGIRQDDRHPVVCVSYAMAAGYAEWLATQTGQRYRLPAAAELERFAAGAAEGCQTNIRDQAYREAFGGRDHAACDDGHAGTAPVGSYPPVPPGLRDVRGNVREWTRDCAAGGCRERIAVGLGWHSAPGEPLRTAFVADQAFNTIGIRVARELD
jgi:serine/threonine-protein kinase PpkA